MTTRLPIALLTLGLLLSPAAAQAAPARIKVFEAQVHTAPDPSSPVIHTFAENARVSVSEESYDGFRRIRLPDGRVGYVEERALSFAAAAPRPPSPPPQEGPPPPPFAPPPPPPRPYRVAPYPPPRLYVDPTAFRHVGFFLRLDLGLGYMGTSIPSTSTSPTFGFDSSHGPAGELGIAIGGAVAENFILAGHFWGTWVASPTLTSRGVSVPSGGDFSTSLVGIGPSFDFYLMPQNVYFSITPSVTWVNFSDSFNSFETAAGFGTRFAIGKEWWLGPHFGMGVNGWFAFSFNRESDSAGPTWRTYVGGVGFSATLN